MKLRVGLIGLGHAWERRHRPALLALADRFEVRAVCEPVNHRAELAAAEFGAAVVDGYQVLVRREDVDAVLILSAGWFGSLPILAACEAGKAIYLAAGLDMKLDDAREIKRRVEESGVVFLAEFPRRQSPATLRLKELIATALGPPGLVFCHRRLPLADEGKHSPALAGRLSAVQELAELVDWCCYVVGRAPGWVTGTTWHEAATGCGQDYQMMSLDFSEGGLPGTGPVAQISCGRYIPARWSEAVTYRPLAAMQISCRRGIAFVDPPATLIWFDEAGRHQESLQNERPLGEQLLTRFHRAMTGPVSNSCDLADAYRALFIVEQAGKSHQSGRRIEL
ncbi:MAG: Gfo/Idh/MocA family oxidoreductase [Planctomycetota bacterium]